MTRCERHWRGRRAGSRLESDLEAGTAVKSGPADGRNLSEKFGFLENVRRRLSGPVVTRPPMAGTRTETFAGPSRTCVHDRPLYATHIPSFTIFPPSPNMDDHPDDSFSDVGSDIFSTRSAETSATSYDVSMRSGSPAPSMYSVTTSIRSASYRQEYGRGINNYSDVYQLPADDEELDRLGNASIKSWLVISRAEFFR